MQQPQFVRLKPKALYADRNWKQPAASHQNDSDTSLQILYEKFSNFNEDRNLLSFKEVKGFLRETLHEFKRFSLTKDQ